MSSYNKVLLMGNVTRDIVVKTTPNGQKVTEVGLAINRTYTQDGVKKEDTTFVDITFWGRQAETLEQYVQKGRALFIEGRLKQDSWTEADGTKRSKLRIHGESFQFIGSRAEGQGGSAPAPRPSTSSNNAPANPQESKGSRAPKSQAQGQPQSREPEPAFSYSEESYEDFDNISDEEIPF